MLIGLEAKSKFAWFFFVLITVIVSALALIIFIIVKAEPIFRERAADAALQAVRNCVDKVAADVFSDESLFITSNDLGDDMSYLEIDTVKLNLMRNSFAEKLQKELSETHRTSIRMTLGSLTDIAALQGIGMTIPAKIYFGAISKVEITDEFISAGINQTKYRASLRVNVSTSVVSTVMADSREVTVDLPLCERILVGKVPNYYISGKG